MFGILSENKNKDDSTKPKNIRYTVSMLRALCSDNRRDNMFCLGTEPYSNGRRVGVVGCTKTVAFQLNSAMMRFDCNYA